MGHDVARSVFRRVPNAGRLQKSVCVALSQPLCCRFHTLSPIQSYPMYNTLEH